MAWQPLFFFCTQDWSLSFIGTVSFPAMPMLASFRGPTVKPICSSSKNFLTNPTKQRALQGLSPPTPTLPPPHTHDIATTTPEQLFPTFPDSSYFHSSFNTLSTSLAPSSARHCFPLPGCSSPRNDPKTPITVTNRLPRPWQGLSLADPTDPPKRVSLPIPNPYSE